MKPTRQLHITLLLAVLACTIADADADATAVGRSSPAAAVPAPSPFVVPSPSPSPALLHAAVVHGWMDESHADPPVSCSLSVAAWRQADSDALADADAEGGGSQLASDSNRVTRGHWHIQQRWRMRSPALILKLTPLHAGPSSLQSTSTKALALPSPLPLQPLFASRWLLQLRCATAAGRRISALPERGIQVDADGEAVSHFALQPPSDDAAAYLLHLRRHLQTPLWLRRLRRVAISRLQAAWLRVTEWPAVRELKWAFSAAAGHATDALGELLRFATPAAFWRAIEDSLRHAAHLARRLMKSVGGSPESFCSPSGVLTAVAALALLHLCLALGLMVRQQRAETSAQSRRRPPLRSLQLLGPKGSEQRQLQQQFIDRAPPTEVERPWLSQQLTHPPLPSAAERKEGGAAVLAPAPLSSAPSAAPLIRSASPLEQLGSAIAAADEAASVAAAALLAAQPSGSAPIATHRPIRHISAASPPPSHRSRPLGPECALQ